MERWDDLGAYFGVHRSNAIAETRNIACMELEVFNDAMTRPRFAVLKFSAETGQYERVERSLCSGMSVVFFVHLLIRVVMTL